MEQKQIKFNFKVKDYPERLLNELQATTEKIAKSNREIPKSTQDWKRELAFAKFDTDFLKQKLEQQLHIYDQLIDKQRQYNNVSQKELDTRLKTIEALRRQYHSAYSSQSAIQAHVGAQTSTGGSLASIVQTFASGGLGGLMGGLAPALLGAGIVGGLVMGAVKTYGWLEDKSKLAREYYTQGLSITRQANLPYSIAGLERYRNYGANSFYTNKQMLDLAQALVESTGSAILNRPESLNSIAQFNMKQGLQFGQTAQILGAGIQGGFIKGTPDITQYFDIYANAMAKGLQLGFSKSETIKQLMDLQKMAIAGGVDTQQSFRELVGESIMLQKTGVRSLMGAGGIEAIHMMRSFLTPNNTTTPAFAALAMNGIIPQSYLASAKTRMLSSGISAGIYNELMPKDKWAILQSGTQYQDLGMFKSIYTNLNKRYGGLAPTMMMQLYGINGSEEPQFLRLLSQVSKMSNADFKRTMEDLSKTPMEKLGESVMGLKVQMSDYYQGQAKLNESVTALRTVIDSEMALEKLKLMISGKLSGQSLKNLTPDELGWALQANIPGALGEQERRLSTGNYTIQDLQKMAQENVYGARTVYSNKLKATQMLLSSGGGANLIKGIIAVESSGNPNAVSNKGAVGLMQLVPSTFNEEMAKLGISNGNIKDPQQNVLAGTDYFRGLYLRYGNVQEALAAYNAGPGAVDEALRKYGKNWLSHMPAETRNYVPSVLHQLPKDQQAYILATGHLPPGSLEGLDYDKTKVNQTIQGAKLGAQVAQISSNTANIVSYPFRKTQKLIGYRPDVNWSNYSANNSELSTLGTKVVHNTPVNIHINTVPGLEVDQQGLHDYVQKGIQKYMRVPQSSVVSSYQ